MAALQMMGGRFRSAMPSNLIYPGACAIEALPAPGSEYASKLQRASSGGCLPGAARPLDASAAVTVATLRQIRLEGLHKTGTRLPAPSKYSKCVAETFSAP